MNIICPCCGCKTISEEYDICPVCFWENDPIQDMYPDCSGGANNVSLIEAKKNYKEFGAIEKRFLNVVRKPYDDELP